MIQEALQKLVTGAKLSQEEAAGVTEEIMTGEATPTQMMTCNTCSPMKWLIWARS